MYGPPVGRGRGRGRGAPAFHSNGFGGPPPFGRGHPHRSIHPNGGSMRVMVKRAHRSRSRVRSPAASRSVSRSRSRSRSGSPKNRKSGHSSSRRASRSRSSSPPPAVSDELKEIRRKVRALGTEAGMVYAQAVVAGCQHLDETKDLVVHNIDGVFAQADPQNSAECADVHEAIAECSIGLPIGTCNVSQIRQGKYEDRRMRILAEDYEVATQVASFRERLKSTDATTGVFIFDVKDPAKVLHHFDDWSIAEKFVRSRPPPLRCFYGVQASSLWLTAACRVTRFYNNTASSSSSNSSDSAMFPV